VPVRSRCLSRVFVRDVATVTDGSDIVTSYALVTRSAVPFTSGHQACRCFDLDRRESRQEQLAKFQNVLPEDIKVSYEFDQSGYVSPTRDHDPRHGRGSGALLTGLMVLLFLHDWRSASIVVINIPIALMGAVLALAITGQTVNIMTLAVWHSPSVCWWTCLRWSWKTSRRSMWRAGPSPTPSWIRRARSPCRCCLRCCACSPYSCRVLHDRHRKAMFLPLALAVGFSMIASYLLASTLVPILVVWLGNRAGEPPCMRHRPGASSGFGSAMLGSCAGWWRCEAAPRPFISR